MREYKTFLSGPTGYTCAVFWRDARRDTLSFDEVIASPSKKFPVKYGWFCGYVEVPPGHPYYGFEYYDVPEISAHGGITFSGSLPGFKDGWWFGFDCAHADDWDNPKSYNFVKKECLRFAQELYDAVKKS